MTRLLLLACALLTAAIAHAAGEPEIVITIRDHKFSPAEISVPLETTSNGFEKIGCPLTPKRMLPPANLIGPEPMAEAVVLIWSRPLLRTVEP